MRITSLRLEKFGHILDTTVRFGPGLTVVHGSNEAGKSTLLDGLGGFLWGVPKNLRTYVHAAAQSALTATVAHGGIEVEQKRRLNRLTCDGQDVPAVWDEAASGGEQMWRTSFGLDTEGLRGGGRKVIQGGADLADLIFLAETGALISGIVDALNARADTIFKPHKAAPTEVRSALKRIEELKRQIASEEASADDVVRLRERVAVLTGRDEALRRQFDDRSREERRLLELQRCQEAASRLAQAQEQLAELDDEGPLLDRAQTEELQQAAEDTERSVLRIGELDSQRDELVARQGKLSANPEILTEDDAVSALVQQLESRRDDRRVAESPAAAARIHATISGLLLRLGHQPLDDVLAQAGKVLVGEPIRERLTTLADAVVRAAGLVEQRADELAGLLEQDSAIVDGGDEQAQALEHARQQRTSVWTRVKAHWISGELPQPSARQQLAGELEAAISVADAVAEARVEAVAAVAEQRGVQQQRAVQAQQAAEHLSRAREARETAERNWRDLADQHSLPAGLDAVSWSAHNVLLAELAAAVGEEATERSRRAEAQRRLAEFASRAEALQALIPERHTDPLRLVEALGAALNEAIGARSADREIAEQLRAVEAALVAQWAAHTEAQAVADRLVPPDQGPVRAVLVRCAARHQAIDAVAAGEAALLVAKDFDSPLDALLEALRAADPVAREGQLASARSDRERLDAELAECNREIGALRGELRGLEQREPVAQLLATLQEQGAKLRLLVDEYRSVKLQAELLRAYQQRLADSTNSPLLAEAGRFIATLTEGRYTGFAVDESGGERRIEIIFHDPSGDAVHRQLKELSEGTADQVFLALRLAGITMRLRQRRSAGGSAVPVVLDDVLMSFDDERTRAALRLLAEIGQEWQIILLTHHESVFRAAADLENVAVSQLDSVALSVA